MTRLAACLLSLVLGLLPLPSAASPTLDDFIRRDVFDVMKISPDGRHIAATVTLDGRGVLVVMRLDDLSKSAQTVMPPNNYVADFWWVGPNRLLFSAEEKFGQLERPLPTGEIFVMSADGSMRAKVLAGRRADPGDAFSRIKKPSQQVFARIVDVLPGNDAEVLISIIPWGKTTYPEVELMNVVTGKRSRVAAAPVPYADFVTDAAGEVRFAFGSETDVRHRTFYRDGRGDAWREINDQAATGRVVRPVGFSADGATAYLQVSEPAGPDALYAFDPRSGTRTRVLGDDTVDPADYLYSPVDQSLYAVLLLDGTPRVEHLDPAHEYSRLLASMAANFPGQLVLPSSFTADGAHALFLVRSDRNPGDFFLLDRANSKARLIASRARWLDPDALAPTRPISLSARDGLVLHGFLTLPPGAGERGLPLIVNPHGGPFGVFDAWLYSAERQLLASRGYAVLQVNFRGSGNHGHAFEAAGYRNWGGSMQDDLTDATRWAIEQGIADPARICIYGRSYGGYAALMGAAREPGLYRCAAGDIGVYDMEMMHRSGDIARHAYGKNYLKEVLGKEELAAISPNRLADRITAAVFLSAGGKDQRAPARHTELMRDALLRAGRQVETTIYPNEGHGYFTMEARTDYHTRLLAFFDRHIGGGSAPGTESSD
jgi:dipeptidyl aminopeptidase/acylaminoacyl peptidase